MPWGMKCDLSTYDWFGAWVLLKKASGLPSMKNDKKKKKRKSWKFVSGLLLSKCGI